jgi:nicotinate phosphoribosyltransferase
MLTGWGAPTAGLVYKLVAREGADGTMVGVAKRSVDKVGRAGRKWALRRRGRDGVDQAEVIGVGPMPAADADDRPLLVPLVQDGEVVGREPLVQARARHRQSRAALPATALQLSRGAPAIPTVYEEGS